jgi:hypothetical protein
VGSASIWDERTRAQRAAGRRAPPATAEGTPPPLPLAVPAEELEALVAGIVQVTLDTRLGTSDPLRRAQLAHTLHARLLELLGGTPASVPSGVERSRSEPAEPPPAEALPPGAPGVVDAAAGSALGRALEARLSLLGGALAARPDLRARLIALAVERAEAPGEVPEASSEELRSLDVLQRRAAKLERSLHESRAALAYVSGLEHVDDGIASIYRVVQGLSLEDPQRERKRAALESLFRSNLALQKPDRRESR